jgi:hypothetical protein
MVYKNFMIGNELAVRNGVSVVLKRKRASHCVVSRKGSRDNQRRLTSKVNESYSLAGVIGAVRDKQSLQSKEHRTHDVVGLPVFATRAAEDTRK